MADRILQLVQGYRFRAILDGPLAVIELQPNNGLNDRCESIQNRGVLMELG